MSEAANETPSREEQLRAARLRALAAFVGMIAIAGAGYYFLRETGDAPPVGCSRPSDCPGLGNECLHAPTGGYCTHTCNRDEDCDPGTHCDVPPWENQRDARALCIHDTAKPAAN